MGICEICGAKAVLHFFDEKTGDDFGRLCMLCAVREGAIDPTEAVGLDAEDLQVCPGRQCWGMYCPERNDCFLVRRASGLPDIRWDEEGHEPEMSPYVEHWLEYLNTVPVFMWAEELKSGFPPSPEPPS